MFDTLFALVRRQTHISRNVGFIQVARKERYTQKDDTKHISISRSLHRNAHQFTNMDPTEASEFPSGQWGVVRNSNGTRPSWIKWSGV